MCKINDNFNEEVTDSWVEHSQHTDEWDKNCSECYKERSKYTTTSNADYQGFEKRNDLELAGELSAHPSNLYW